MKKTNKNTKKIGPEIGGVDPESKGQNDYWPGEALKKPGTVVRGKDQDNDSDDNETNVVPVVR